MSIDAEVCVTWGFREASMCDIDWSNGVAVTDIDLVGRNSNKWSISGVEFVDDGTLVSYVGVVI